MLLVTIAIASVLVLLVYNYFKNTYFTLRGTIPGLPPQFILGNLFQTGIVWRDEPMPMVFLELKRRFGDVCQFWMGPMRVTVISHLDDAQHIFTHRQIYDQGKVFVENFSLVYPNALICLEGTKYKRHANAISFLFRRSKILPHMDTMIDCTDKLLHRWRTHYQDPTVVHKNIVEQSQQLLLAIFGYIAFDFDLETLNEENGGSQNELTQALHTFLGVFPTIVKLPLILSRLYLCLNQNYRKSRVIIRQYIDRMIDQELEENEATRVQRKRHSLIASLVTLLKEHEQSKLTNDEDRSSDHLVGLSSEEILDEMLFLLTAGYGTTATAVTWFIHLMSKHPQTQKKLKEELAQHLKARFTVDQIESCIYLDCVLRELLRFVPPAVGTLRTLAADDQLPGTGVSLQKDEQVFIPFYNFGRDERYWRGPVGPDQFYPERFFNEDADLLNTKSASFAFGGGHRQCIGQDLARFELKVICARLMQFVTFGDGGAEVNAGGYVQRETVLPKHIGVTVTFD